MSSIFAILLLASCVGTMDKELVSAASEGNVARVTELLKRGANVNYHTSDAGTTPLIAAASNGHITTIEILLSAGADLNAVDSDVGTALYWAAFNGKVDAMKLLLSRGSRFNCSNSAATYLLKTIRARGFGEAESITRAQLQREGISA